MKYKYNKHRGSFTLIEIIQEPLGDTQGLYNFYDACGNISRCTYKEEGNLYGKYITEKEFKLLRIKQKLQK